MGNVIDIRSHQRGGLIEAVEQKAHCYWSTYGQLLDIIEDVPPV
jgi:hypothetical protein